MEEFVISAGGIRAAFPAVYALYDNAPVLPRWTWVKFRPRRLPIHDVDFGGKKVRAEDVRYLLAKDGEKVGIVLFFDGYNEPQKATYGQIGYLFLDEALGEYAVETQVGFIEFHSREPAISANRTRSMSCRASLMNIWLGGFATDSTGPSIRTTAAQVSLTPVRCGDLFFCGPQVCFGVVSGRSVVRGDRGIDPHPARCVPGVGGLVRSVGSVIQSQSRWSPHGVCRQCSSVNGRAF